MQKDSFEIDQGGAQPRPEDFVSTYVRHLHRWRIPVLAAWAVLTFGLHALGLTDLIPLTKNEFDPPVGSSSRVAKTLMSAAFPGIDKRNTDVIYFEVARGHSVFENGLLQYITAAVDEILREEMPRPPNNFTITGYMSKVAEGVPPDFARPMFVDGMNSSSYVFIIYPNRHTMRYGKAIQSCLRRLRSSSHPALAYMTFVGGAGNGLQSIEALDEGAKSMTSMELISMPLAFMIIGLSLNSLRLLVLPFATLATGHALASGIMVGLAHSGLSVSSATPPLMMSMLLAVSIDYALFLLTRFKEEVKAGANIHSAVLQMVLHSGHTVCGSGFTLAICFFSLLFFPVHMIQSIGLGVIMSILSAIVINLTIIPAALLAFPKFFTDKCGQSSLPDGGSRNVSLTGDASLGSPSVEFQSTGWYRWSRFATSDRAAVLASGILVLVGGCSLLQCKYMVHSMDTWLMAPRISVSLDTYNHFSRCFSRGSTSPFQLLLVPNFTDASACSAPIGGTGFYAEPFWNNATALLQNIAADIYDFNTGPGNDEAMAPGGLHSIMYVKGDGFRSSSAGGGQPSGLDIPMPMALFLDPKAPKTPETRKLCSNAKMFLMGLSGACNRFLDTKRCQDLELIAPVVAQYLDRPKNEVVGLCTVYQELLSSSTTANRDTVYATLTPAVMDRSRESVEWTRVARDYLTAHAGRYPCLVTHLHGETPQMVDTIDSIYNRAPAILLITMLVCLLLVSFLTVSLAFGLSSVCLIGWTLLVVFATGDLVYRGNIIGAVTGSITSLHGTGGLAWMVPPLTFSMIFGLGLDYNIFLLGRVCEYHDAGFSDSDALALGVARTGPVISSAGLIMAVAFSGMMFSDIPMLNQVGFFLVWAVLLDTFFVRSLATPALHTPLKAWNWWPRGAFR